jgi:hypothetical protein
MKPLCAAVFALVLVHLSAPAAHAYLDPGVGSMALQLILAGFAGLAVILRLLWRRILVFFGFKDATVAEASTDDPDA